MTDDCGVSPWPEWDGDDEDDEPQRDTPTSEPAPYNRVIGIQFRPVPPDRDVLWDVTEE